ncbi:GPW/gp25 family protein [Phytohabitans sp. LJ34]|uniref:GPW/gp25 family protein n=1 Tax=Phytohabitans sp. LJ34 TaxID=3452217 RepID=UPI003F8A3BA9
MASDFYGRGIAHPFGTGATGGIREAADLAKIEQSIRIILGTQHGERLMRPTFGANLRGLAFAPNSPATANLARHLVKAALDEWEPRIDVTGVEVAHDNGRAALSITVRYRVKGGPETGELTVPVPLELS